MDGQPRIEQVGQANALGLGDESKQFAVAIEAPGQAFFDHFEALLVVPVEKHAVGAARGVFEGQLNRVGAEPLDVDDSNETVGYDAANRRGLLEVFELRHSSRSLEFSHLLERYSQHHKWLPVASRLRNPELRLGTARISSPLRDRLYLLSDSIVDSNVGQGH